MDRTMSDAEDTVRYWLGEEFGGPVTRSERDQFNAAVRGVLAELDAERAAHNETKAERDHYRNAARSAERSLVNGCHADARATLHAAFKRNSEREV